MYWVPTRIKQQVAEQGRVFPTESKGRVEVGRGVLVGVTVAELLEDGEKQAAWVLVRYLEEFGFYAENNGESLRNLKQGSNKIWLQRL